MVKGAIWTAAQLEDTFGIVHSDLVKEINTFGWALPEAPREVTLPK